MLHISSFKFKDIDKEIFHFALPALGGLAIDPLVSLVDTMFVGRLGEVPLAALGINASLFALAFLGFIFLAYATTPMVSGALGNNDSEKAGAISAQALFLALVLGLLMCVVLQVFAVPFLRLMGAADDVMPAATVYLRIRSLAGPAMLMLIASRGILYGHGDARRVLWIVAFMNLVNLLLDPLLMFGLGWGVAGAAWATTIAQYVGAGFFLRDFLLRPEVFRLRFAGMTGSSFLPFIQSGTLLMLRTFALILVMTLATAVATRVGTRAVASHHVVMQLWSLLALVIDALADTAKTLVPKYLGQNNSAKAKEAAQRTLFWGFWGGVLLGIVFWLLEPILPRLFTDKPAVLQQVRQVFLFVVFMQPLNGVVFVLDGIIMGLKAWPFLAVAMVVSSLFTSAVMFMVLPFGWGLAGVWWAIVALMFLRCITLGWGYIRFLQGKPLL